MNILFYHPTQTDNSWVRVLQKYLPDANIVTYQESMDSTFQADYALVWRPTDQVFTHQKKLKAVFALGAGVDALLDQLKLNPNLIPKGVPLYRLEDSGMVLQMQEYTIAAVMRYFRRFDDYALQQQEKIWRYIPPYQYSDFTICVLGLGVLGAQVAQKLASLGFTVKGWSRSVKAIDDVTCYGQAQLAEAVNGSQLVINLLPSTPDTQGILNMSLFNQLNKGAYLINIARGKHLIEDDLLTALDSQQIKAATLDVFVEEPLPKSHPFWERKGITITPHISAITIVEAGVSQIVNRIERITAGEHVLDGLVDLQKGY